MPGHLRDGHEIHKPARQQPVDPAAPDRFDAAEVAFVLGHEIQHGFNDADVERAYVQFDADVEQIAGRTTSHDYTEAIGTLLAANRRDEASSNIAGWNALVSQVRANDPDATLRDLYEASPAQQTSYSRDPGRRSPMHRTRS